MLQLQNTISGNSNLQQFKHLAAFGISNLEL